MLFAAMAGAAVVYPVASAPAASADPCPDVQVVFARGTFEPAGVGAIGQAFVDSLRAQLPNKSVAVYAVNYPASLDFARAADGVLDASNKVQDVVTTCPNTKMVLGGYSQGAAVMAYTTTDTLPPNYQLPAGITGPMPKSTAGHVAAVTLFGKPSSGFLQMLDQTAPPITIGAEYGPKALDLCVDNDPVCSGNGGDPGAHGSYAVNGMTDQAAGFAAQHVTTDVT
ncbi:cutinase family protein [Mycolicibacterium komossense]|uniref:Cutinase family protein n=1 Tax=Mycolicibacterium komossense TaxID=1779 RepID=A0ABT3CAU0_9MYCO|nr:cutinase family protein [Mycolicibacterium komossense]MCV7226562.1 cutinase family protein [Mycolicibacterium komossense]